MHRVCGAILSHIDVRDYKMVCSAKKDEFPSKFELPIVRIKDQESTGSCVAHALSSIIEFYNVKQHNDATEMSVGYIYGNRTNSSHKESGMIIRDALNIVSTYGDVPKYLFPYNEETPMAIKLYERDSEKLYETGRPCRISEYCRINTINEAKTCLIAGVPLLMAIEWYDDMEVDQSGVLHTNYSGYAGGHCMYIYGWDERGWKVANSWSMDWGIDGCFILPYENHIAECWAVLDDIIDGAYIKRPFKTKIGRIVAKIVNKVANSFQMRR